MMKNSKKQEVAYMGIYLNPDSSKFEEAVNSDIYVDKTGLLTYTNSVLHTMQKYICISRPRRFGKSTAANMLTAYYSKGCSSREMFSNLRIIAGDVTRSRSFHSLRLQKIVVSRNT